MAESDALGGLQEWIGQRVVLDVRSPYVILGVLSGCRPGWVELADADVHDLRDSQSTRELYLVDAARHGIRRNRRRVCVRTDEIVCVAALDDVTED